jgi:hypothetical protein
MRHHLGISAFGVTAWTAHAAGDVVINSDLDPIRDEPAIKQLVGD